MKLRWIGLGIGAIAIIAAGGAAWGAVQPASAIDGGGSRSANSLRRIKGTIGGLAMLSGRGPELSTATRTIIPGFYGAAEGRRALFNAADPAWMELGELPSGAIAPRGIPAQLHAFNDAGHFRFDGPGNSIPNKRVL